MSEVTLSIGGRQYTVACAEGEEAHVTKLGELIDGKLQEMGPNLSPQESQNLLFGALFVADELHEEKKSGAAAKSTLETHASELAQAKRDASEAVGQTSELEKELGRLQQELNGLMSVQQQHATNVEKLRVDLKQKSEALENAESEKASAAAELTSLRKERDSQAKQIKTKDELLEQANAHLESARAANSSSDTAISSEMAPALERFADLLENCADKLEGKTANA